MIAKLKGLIDSVGDDWAIIDVSGVGYLVFASGRTLGRLVEGQAAELMIETHVREDHIHLYGFWDENERDWFKLLTTVQGVGAKVGLALLTVLAGEELVRAIASGDKAAITRAAGVGPKLATRILSELKDKVGKLALGPAAAGGASIDVAAGSAATETADAVSALVNLGYGASEALVAVSSAQGQMDDDVSVEALIRAGLAELGPRDLGR
ncbi:MAG: Holliday junction branch migration protein RuvA [Rhodospirillaceae bacterium]|jgi:holliday junction DNA helicase RuvA|nr:Holliday junction branch migration protein RuvA [Rhodospirillales bacterium]MBT3905229.1 Holliday junction branch migration protein RuvA [Rhodospirillaceae bacterium]MBT4699871.1 Holliday junction branch migration protein RuvA [Rhodospirillaceae bacterium]MBT5033358.1 Holliday junction branch migration protein RuvA [Rhodospirillaceae bacterium]MBT6219202.1 Holliday junction branch migration protein RuvA [Rhodospirillaceae bacterium]